jgi:hypothetical protein
MYLRIPPPTKKSLVAKDLAKIKSQEPLNPKKRKVLNKSLKLDEISDSDDDIADVTDDSNASFEDEEFRKSRHSIN